MRQNHPAGEAVFVDFAGSTIPWWDVKLGEDRNACVLVSVQGCSSYTFAYAVASQKSEDWIDAHNAMYRFHGDVTNVLVSDNLKSAVQKARPKRILNRTYEDMGRHYQTTQLPSCVYTPQDNAKAEAGVKLVSRWIIAVLRRRKFFSIEEINKAIAELIDGVNDRPMRRFEGSRRSRFEKFDRPLLKPLPAKPYEFARWISSPRIDRDYHALVEKHAYSVPFTLVGENVEARVTHRIVEIYHSGVRVAAHRRSQERGGFTTADAHRPAKHKAYAQQNLSHFAQWAERIGPATVEAVSHQFDDKPPYSLMAAKACSELKDIARRYGVERFEAACVRARAIESLTVKSIRSILQCRLD
jgi:transposase